jgi:CDP-diglyceride synthetase
MEPERPSVRAWITDSAIIIAAITVTVYLYALSAQIAYQRHFKIPLEFIPLTPAGVLTMGWTFIFILFLILITIGLLSYFIYCLINYLSNRFPHSFEPLFRQFATEKTNPLILLLRSALRDLLIIFIFFITVVLVTSFAYYSGKRAAEHQKEFLVVNKSPDVPEALVVLQISGDYLVTRPLDRTTQEIEKKIYLLKMSEMAKTPLTTENVGPLKVKR